jgi:hypothetical protein
MSTEKKILYSAWSGRLEKGQITSASKSQVWQNDVNGCGKMFVERMTVRR